MYEEPIIIKMEPASYQAMVIVFLLFLAGTVTTESSSQETPNSTVVLPQEEMSTTSISIAFVEPMKNYSKNVGESLKIRCAVRGQPPADRFQWFKNEAPLQEQRGRIKIRSKTGSGDIQWSTVKFKDLETMDMAWYR